jgi:hypothetical protein
MGFLAKLSRSVFRLICMALVRHMNPDSGSASWCAFCGNDSVMLGDDFMSNEQAQADTLTRRLRRIEGIKGKRSINHALFR